MLVQGGRGGGGGAGVQGVVVAKARWWGLDIEVVERSKRGGGKRDSVDRGCGWGSRLVVGGGWGL